VRAKALLFAAALAALILEIYRVAYTNGYHAGAYDMYGFARMNPGAVLR